MKDYSDHFIHNINLRFQDKKFTKKIQSLNNDIEFHFNQRNQSLGYLGVGEFTAVYGINLYKITQAAYSNYSHLEQYKTKLVLRAFNANIDGHNLESFIKNWTIHKN
jgi:hypothetical protein